MAIADSRRFRACARWTSHRLLVVLAVQETFTPHVVFGDRRDAQVGTMVPASGGGQ